MPILRRPLTARNPEAGSSPKARSRCSSALRPKNGLDITFFKPRTYRAQDKCAVSPCLHPGWNQRQSRSGASSPLQQSKMRPALAITEGMFNDIGESNIKVGRKYGENDKLLEDVIIHEKSIDKSNHIVIKAEKGELRSDELQEGLQLVLYNGYRYEELKQKKNKKKHPHNRIAFQQYTMNIDLRSFNDIDLNENKDIPNEGRIFNVWH